VDLAYNPNQFYKVVYDSLPTSALEVHLTMPDFAKAFALIDDDAALKNVLIGLFSALGTQFATTSAASVFDRIRKGGEKLKDVKPVTSTQVPASIGQLLAIGSVLLSELLPA
jgi:hypothetical protein